MYNILVIAPTPFFADRGCHIRIFEEARALQRLGHKITICTYHIGRDINGFEIKRILSIPWYKKLSAGPSWHKIYLDLLLFLKALLVGFKTRPDIIHAHLHEGVFVAKLVGMIFGLPVVADFQGSLTAEISEHGFIRKRGLLSNISRWLENRIDRMPDHILVSSTPTKQSLVQQFHLSEEKVTVATDGVDTEIFHPGYNVENLRVKLRLSKNERIVVFLGLLTKYQGVDLLLQAVPLVLKKVPDTHFLIMGYPNVEHYRQMARNLRIGKKVSFAGRIDYSFAPQYLCLGDIAVSAKISTTEANGKLYNYIACGLPTVVFDTPVNREILGCLGIYAKLGNYVSLAQALISALSDKELLSGLKERLRRRAINEFSWLKSGERIVGIYEQLIKKRIGVITL